MTHLEKTELQLGYIPLLDCIALLWAQHQGYFSQAGLNVTLIKEASWASLRDRLCFGALDAAHCLSAILPATTLGDEQNGIKLKTPLVLSVNSAFISLSQRLCYDLKIDRHEDVKSSAQKISHAITQGKNIQFAHVFKHSIHHYCLREWLALPDPILAKKVQLHTLPPPYMVDAIRNHRIDGFCVGDPWNTQAQLAGYSQIIAHSQSIIPAVADKVLAMTEEWATLYPNTLKALTHAIQQAQQDLKDPQNFAQIWQLLKADHIIQFECETDIHTQSYYHIQQIIQHFVNETTPQTSDFVWLIQQMIKWDQLNISEDIHTLAQSFICA